MKTDKNSLKAARFERPDYIPMRFGLGAPCWNYYPKEELKELVLKHPLLFPDGLKGFENIKLPPYAVKDKPYTDPWGCLWVSPEDGITGTVTEHPLADWKDFENYRAPDPEKSNGRVDISWQGIKKANSEAKKKGITTGGGLPHGHTFLRLCDIRGYENLLFDMVDENPKLYELIEMVGDFNLQIIKRYLESGADGVMSYPEDLGMQSGPMISPEHFRKYIKPVYERIIAPARDAGCLIHMHSDGDIRTLIDQLTDSGVQVINLQDLVNGIGWIKENLKGKFCIDLDIDRQKVTRFGTPQEVEALIREEVESLGSKEGGLMMTYGLYPGVPLENIRALMDAMEKYAFYYSS